MQYYEALAQELMRSLDQKIKSPPQEEISAAMRGEMAVLRLLRREEKPLPAGEISPDVIERHHLTRFDLLVPPTQGQDGTCRDLLGKAFGDLKVLDDFTLAFVPGRCRQTSTC